VIGCPSGIVTFRHLNGKFYIRCQNVFAAFRHPNDEISFRCPEGSARVTPEALLVRDIVRDNVGYFAQLLRLCDSKSLTGHPGGDTGIAFYINDIRSRR